MDILKNFISGEYAICYRHVPKGGGLLFQNDKTMFQTLPVSKYYWYADPMLFEAKGRRCLFFEAFEKRCNLGRIACCELKEDGTFTEVKIVISEEFHLSYPDVFSLNGIIYMIPETSASNQIQLYECTDFPYKWRKLSVLSDNIKTVDSTLFEYGGKTWLFSAEIDNTVTHGTKLNLYEVAEGFKLIPHPGNPVITDIALSRPAGKTFQLNGEIIRPSQDCSEGEYGRAVKFNKITCLTGNAYSEETFCTVKPDNISIDSGKKLSGCHTYGLSENGRFEIIDVKINKIDMVLGLKISVYHLLEKLGVK